MVASVPLETKRIFSMSGDGASDEGGEFEFEFGGDAEAGAARGLVGDGRGDRGMGVAEEHARPRSRRSRGAVAVGVVEILGFAVFDDERVAADGAEGADGGVDAADEEFFGRVKISRERGRESLVLACGAVIRDSHF